MATNNHFDVLKFYLKIYKLEIPEKEYKFCKTRRWKFDFAWVSRKTAVEIEGGVWIQGRHSRGKGMIGDMEKYNHATLDGWKILRYTPKQLQKCVEDIKILFG